MSGEKFPFAWIQAPVIDTTPLLASLGSFTLAGRDALSTVRELDRADACHPNRPRA